MANDNANRIEKTWNEVMGNEPVQFIYGKNPKQITAIIFKGEKISTSAWCGKAIEEKIMALKNTQSCVKQANEVMINDERNTIYLNGVRYTMWDIIKEMELDRVYEMINEQLQYGEDWQSELANRLRYYMLTEGIIRKIAQGLDIDWDSLDEIDTDEDDDYSDLVYTDECKKVLGYV